jgi:hypothetical protein
VGLGLESKENFPVQRAGRLARKQSTKVQKLMGLQMIVKK